MCWQVQAYIKGTAVSGVVQNALESFGTPNLLLQIELVSVPTVVISPSALAPLVLFQNSFATSGSQNIVLNNTGNSTITFEVRSAQITACGSEKFELQHHALHSSVAMRCWQPPCIECILEIVVPMQLCHHT